WVEEECAALAAQPVAERVEDPSAFTRLKGARELSPRGLAVLRELYELREHLARAHDRPPFKILAEETLVRLAQAAPGDRPALAQVPGCTPRVIERWGEAIHDAVAHALARRGVWRRDRCRARAGVRGSESVTDRRANLIDDDVGLAAILREAKTVAVLGAKADPAEPAYYV